MAKLSDDELRNAWAALVAVPVSLSVTYSIPELHGVMASLGVLVQERGACLKALDEAIVHLDRVQATLYSAMETLKAMRARYPA